MSFPDRNAIEQRLYDFLGSATTFNQTKNDDTIFASEARTSSENSAVFSSVGFKGVRLFLDISAVSGSPTLDLKVQVYDELSDNYVDLPGASFPQQTGTGQAILTIYPGIGETANEGVSDVLGSQYRVVATIGGSTPSLTFTLYADYIK